MGHTSSITISYSNLNRSDTSGKPYTNTIQIWNKGKNNVWRV